MVRDKTKMMMQQNSCTTQAKKNIHSVTNDKTIDPILGTLCAIIR
jgi:hypothetical protein